MSKIVALTYLTLDGVMENPSWTGPFWNDEHNKYAYGQLFNSDALLNGRTTYEAFASSWPTRDNSDPFTARMNSLPKYVVSNTLEKAEWNNSTIVTGDLAEEIAKIKSQHDKDILIYGSADLTNSLIKLGLVDELKLWIHPVIVGTGKRFFPEGLDTSTWKLASTTAFSSGAIILDYRPAA